LIEEDLEKNKSIMKKHIDELNKYYNQVTLINLIDKKKDQFLLGNYFNLIHNNILEEYPDDKKPNYIWFDFHENCKKMKYENLEILLTSNIFQKYLKENKYLHVKIPKDFNKVKKYNLISENENENVTNFSNEVKIISYQKGIFRTNCIDCLDRTNIVQTLISRHLTQRIISDLNISVKKTYTGKIFDIFRKTFESEFRNIWTNHGDVLSNCYSGTGAQKSDFSKTGKRTYYGVVSDLFKSIKRFFVNNINDNYYQACHDLFLNRVNVKEIQNIKKPSDKIFLSLTIVTISYLVYWLSKVMKKKIDSLKEE
jgi:hypothetical protein